MKDPNDLSQFPAEIVETVTAGGTRIDCEHGMLTDKYNLPGYFPGGKLPFTTHVDYF